MSPRVEEQLPAHNTPVEPSTEVTEFETPVGAERPPTASSTCNKCSRLSKSVRRLQKENA